MSFNFSETVLTELQIHISQVLQSDFAQVHDASEIDAFTYLNYWVAIGEEYLKNLKEQYEKMTEDRKGFETAVKEDLEALAETIEE